MKVLIFSRCSLDNTDSLGNTMSNFFEGEEWEKDEFYSIYLRNSNPNNNFCDNYYRMTLNSMVKNYFSRNKIGEKFVFSELENNISNDKITKENKFINFLHKYNIRAIYPFADFVYRRKKWLNSNFTSFISDYNPDIFFAFLTDISILYPIVKYLKECTKTKVVLFAADNDFDAFNNRYFFEKNKLKNEFKSVIKLADKLYGITDEICDYYSNIFNVNFSVLRKGCEFSNNVKEKNGNVLKFVYAGNLFYGRDASLISLVESLKEINKNGTKAILEIYTPTSLSDNVISKLNVENCSYLKGKRSFREIIEIESTADYVLHVESFEKKYVDLVKYSFSTKIIDCLQSGSCIIGIGPNNISSINYLKKIPGAYVINDISEIHNEIEKLVNNKNIYNDSVKIRKFAVSNHDIKNNQKRIREDFESLINSDKKV